MIYISYYEYVLSLKMTFIAKHVADIYLEVKCLDLHLLYFLILR
jgi:hypothetical protein